MSKKDTDKQVKLSAVKNKRIQNIGTKKIRSRTMKRVFQIMQIQNQYPRFLEVEGLKILNQEIVDPMQKKMEAAGYDEKIIQSTRVLEINVTGEGILDFAIISDYEADGGHDVALGREEGTEGVFLRPVFKLALTWIQQGIRLFSFGHWRPGIDATHIVRDVVRENTPAAQAKLDAATDRMFSKILNSK